MASSSTSKLLYDENMLKIRHELILRSKKDYNSCFVNDKVEEFLH